MTMKIAVIGCGAMGSVYAARLALGGHDVLVTHRRAEHVSAINANGLLLVGPDGEHRAEVRAYRAPPEETVDLVVLAVKAADAGESAAPARALIGDMTTVLTIQNGLGAADDVAEEVGAHRLAVGIASGFGASLRGPGQAHHSAMNALRFGAYDGLDPRAVEAVAAAWRAGGFDAAAVSDIAAMQWEKLICNVAYSAPCALTGLTVGEVMDDPDIAMVSQAAAVEAWETALALGIDIGVRDPVAHVLAFGSQVPAAKPSALLDIEAGRVSEIGVINGAIPRQAAKVDRMAPVNATLTALVRARESRFGNP
jgi:2-dehydropantoate 2-reductase